ncbi:ATP-grasp domain-containing protein [Psychrobacter aquaticus]|uniref:ATP-grasp domain-containing protein n=1 Tax=Psychrobacter aquaticus CMS 56 TaxID=1354303 RepID=U4T4B7_9GAMM|nr:hypothetical protein [Psychrobacter aquaticus]ERL56202.1 hypothetical protein M917_0880 [Psychrobacter aquaticus CMS 56]
MTIYLLTLPNGAFGSAGQSWKMLDLEKIKSQLDFKVIVKSILDIENIVFNNDDILIYTSSPDENIRTFLKNSLFYVKDKIKLIPSFELLMAHEDKGFQEVLKKHKNIGDLNGRYIFDVDDHSLPFPKVLKTSQGAGSSGVFLVKKKKDLKNIRKDFLNEALKRKLINTQRKFKLSRSEYKIYSYSKKLFYPFVEQDFIPNLQHDFKVLVFGNRYFVLKRSIRKNDFRASGSGDFEFIEPSQAVLDYAKKISLALDNPYLSLDIAQSDRGCHLIEFQGTNFGPYTLLNASYRYVFKDNEWLKEENCKDLEANYGYALNHYINTKLRSSDLHKDKL